MTEPRRLRGHNAAATCCIASHNRPGLVATAAEDGFVCWYDLRCKDVLFTIDVGNGNPVSSLCFKPGNEDIIYVTAGNEVKSFDLHVIIDVHQRCLYKTLRAGHNSICSSVQFLPWRSWEVISGGLDSKLVMWDFSNGRPNTIMDFGIICFCCIEGDAGQCCNPAFVHALIVPDLDIVDKVGKICVAARGDGVVSIINIDSQTKSKISTKPKADTKSKPKNRAESQIPDQNDRNLQLDYSVGGHGAAVSSVAFSMFGEKGKFVISGGNDKSVKVWDLLKAYDDAGELALHDAL
ncbi:WD repeat-containing protein 53 [Phtheirospermum japonicum]|uniref:WD repeat-containing protein 53 n=1 Tax=Phtheirospermum japonicum TaxID=374723 RepID=A0A830BUF0_9LAMI|nr:WD repeat-containing protein 53 [Phtheirospermum japonicum]